MSSNSQQTDYRNAKNILDQFYEPTDKQDLEGTLEDLLLLEANEQYLNSMEERLIKRKEYDEFINNRKPVILEVQPLEIEIVEEEEAIKESNEEFMNQLQEIDLLTKKSKIKQSKKTKSTKIISTIV